MSTLYESIKSLCDDAGIKPGKMCVELGLSKSMMTGLKNGRKQSIQVETAQKIADYFGVSVDRVLGTEQKEKPAHGVDELDEITKKLHKIIEESTEEERQDMLDYVEFMMTRRKNDRK